MSQPTDYTRRYRFADWSANNPTAPVPGSQLDAEFDDIESVLKKLRQELTALREQVRQLSQLL